MTWIKGLGRGDQTGPKSNDNCPYQGTRRETNAEREKDHVMMVAEVKGCSHKPKNDRSCQKLEETRTRISPGVSGGSVWPC